MKSMEKVISVIKKSDDRNDFVFFQSNSCLKDDNPILPATSVINTC